MNKIFEYADFDNTTALVVLNIGEYIEAINDIKFKDECFNGVVNFYIKPYLHQAIRYGLTILKNNQEVLGKSMYDHDDFLTVHNSQSEHTNLRGF
jgi:hypothetical protein